MRRPSAAAVAAVGFALLFTPALLVIASALKYLVGVGFLYDGLAGLFATGRALDRLSPAVLAGASLLALVLNVYAVADLTSRNRPGVKRRLANLAVIVLSGLLLMVLAGSAFSGNAGLLRESVARCVLRV
jgi:hypothetical protein